MRNSKTLVVITAVIILVAFLALFNFAPEATPEPEATATDDSSLTVDTTPALELESYQDTIDAYNLQPATVNIQN
jgi:hypothetical protein